MEFNVISVLKKKLKFPIEYDQDILQNKFDLLFTVSKLMGYEVSEYHGSVSSDRELSVYQIEIHYSDSESTGIDFRIHDETVLEMFFVHEGSMKLQIFNPYNLIFQDITHVKPENTMDSLLENLDAIMNCL